MKLTITNPQPYTVVIPGVGSVPALGTAIHILTEEQFRQFSPELNAAMTRLGLTYTATAEPAEIVITNLSTTSVPFDPTGTDLTSTEVDSAIKEVYAAIDVFDPADTDLTSTTVGAAIKEVYAAVGEGGGAPASKLTFDPTGTGLAATTVQAAIAEVNAAIPQLEDRVAALEGAPSNLGGALAASWSPSIDINSINGGSLTLDA